MLWHTFVHFKGLQITHLNTPNYYLSTICTLLFYISTFFTLFGNFIHFWPLFQYFPTFFTLLTYLTHFWEFTKILSFFQHTIIQIKSTLRPPFQISNHTFSHDLKIIFHFRPPKYRFPLFHISVLPLHFHLEHAL